MNKLYCNVCYVYITTIANFVLRRCAWPTRTSHQSHIFHHRLLCASSTTMAKQALIMACWVRDNHLAHRCLALLSPGSLRWYPEWLLAKELPPHVHIRFRGRLGSRWMARQSQHGAHNDDRYAHNCSSSWLRVDTAKSTAYYIVCVLFM